MPRRRRDLMEDITSSVIWSNLDRACISLWVRASGMISPFLSLYRKIICSIFFNTSRSRCCDARSRLLYWTQQHDVVLLIYKVTSNLPRIGLCQQHDVVPLIYKVTSNLPFSDSVFFSISTIISILILLLPAQQSVHYVFDRMLHRDKKKFH
jgi:hypothetical protein